MKLQLIPYIMPRIFQENSEEKCTLNNWAKYKGILVLDVDIQSVFLVFHLLAQIFP